MSERANFRGAGTGGRGASHHHSHHSHSHSHQHQRGGGGRGGRGGGGGSSSGLHANANTTTTGTTTNSSGNAGGTQGEKLKKENILDLGKYLNKEIRVKFNGGREVTGVLKGHDQLMNLVLDDVMEVLHDDEGTQSSRPLGLIVARGTLLVMISPKDGSEEIENPFLGVAVE